MVGKKPHDMRVACSRDAVLNFVEFEDFDRAPNIVGRPPLADMRLEGQSGRLCLAVQRHKSFYRLSEFVAGEIKRVVQRTRKEWLEPGLQKVDRNVSRQARLSDPFDVRRGGGVDARERPKFDRVAHSACDRPDIVAKFKPCHAVVRGLNERGLEAKKPTCSTLKLRSHMRIDVGMHLIHGGQRRRQWFDVSAGA